MFAQTTSSRPPQLPFRDSPFSIHGRFNRMSYLGGYGLIYLVTLLGYFILASFHGSFQLSSNLFNFEFYSSLSGASALVVWAFSLFLIYLNIVLVVRRLHDLNKSGWMGLLLFIPVVQFFFMIYLLLASGTAGPNEYGPVRPATFIEKLMAWLILVAILVSLISTAGIFYYFSGTDTLETPTQILQKGTEYF
ncbi:DUF805 domain-containing protein [Acinetobacter oleivorans]|uniref:DUF805 domain-containing protein n=1 Tax=Acinetobacter oleivorans TaxID=1148157 RepID=UPI0012505946|nr:DUF805 domain-containing protein [Acinetobacter oleivorans]